MKIVIWILATLIGIPVLFLIGMLAFLMYSERESTILSKELGEDHELELTVWIEALDGPGYIVNIYLKEDGEIVASPVPDSVGIDMLLLSRERIDDLSTVTQLADGTYLVMVDFGFADWQFEVDTTRNQISNYKKKVSNQAELTTPGGCRPLRRESLAMGEESKIDFRVILDIFLSI